MRPIYLHLPPPNFNSKLFQSCPNGLIGCQSAAFGVPLGAFRAPFSNQLSQKPHIKIILGAFGMALGCLSWCAGSKALQKGTPELRKGIKNNLIVTALSISSILGTFGVALSCISGVSRLQGTPKGVAEPSRLDIGSQIFPFETRSLFPC